MPVIVARKARYAGTVTPGALNVETVVVDVPPQEDDYLVEGYIDLGALARGDAVEIREYIAVDGQNYRLFLRVAVDGPAPEPVVRLHTKTLLYGMAYRVTVVQTAGTPRSLPYGFIVEILGTV
jgi:hypothetical protein